jgi:uncharacterized protein Yka (UPF0111/DUF47 family)
MLWLKKLMGRDDRFFDLLEAAADEAKASVDIFGRYLQALAEGASAAKVDDLVHARRKEKRIRQEMTEALSRTFVTPLDREDIEALSFALYRIPKQVEKIVERMSIYPGRVPHEAFRRQAELMLQASDAVVTMVRQLRGRVDIVRIRETNERLQFAEGEADKVMLALLKDLYNGDSSAKELVILGEIYEMIEQAVDRCRNAGNIVVQIALKDS